MEKVHKLIISNFTTRKKLIDALRTVKNNITYFTKRTRINMKCLTINLSVWGSDYTKFFVMYSLPSLFSPNNLPFISKKRNIYFDIFTTLQDKELIQNTIKSAHIYKCARFNFSIISSDPFKNKYTQMNNYHAVSLQKAKQRKSLLSFLSPDAVLADGGFRTVEQALEQGYSAVCCMAPCANKKTAKYELDKYIKKNIFRINARKLAKIWFDHKNTLAKSHFVNNHLGILISPSYFYFSVNQYNMISRQFHLHPIVVDPENAPMKIDGTFDLFFVEETVRDYEKVKIITDSDYLNYVEFSLNYKNSGGLNKAMLYYSMPRFLIQSSKLFNLKNVWTNIYYHATSRTKSKKVEKMADIFIQDLLNVAICSTRGEVMEKMTTNEVINSFSNYIRRKIIYWVDPKNTEYKRFVAHLFKLIKNIEYYLCSYISKITQLIPNESFDEVIAVRQNHEGEKNKPDIIYNGKKTLVLYSSSAHLVQFLKENKDKIYKYGSQIKFEKISNS